jgi:assimilatory nitrate reductase catalytic subunit
MTRTGRVPRLMTHAEEPLLDMHPEDAVACGVANGGLARIESRYGAAVLRVRLSSEQRRGEVFAPMHWTDRFASAGPIDRLVGAAVDPISGQPELKATPAKVTVVTTLWRGFLLRRSEAPLAGDFHWSRLPLATGQCFALAGWQPLPRGSASEGWIMALLDAAADAELIVYADPRRGIFRYASIVAERLDACLFLAPAETGLPERDAVAALLGETIDASARVGLVAGRPMSATATADRSRIVCSCFAIGLRALHDAIAERHLTSVAEIGATLRAGTNCGTCVPELRQILRTTGGEAGASA